MKVFFVYIMSNKTRRLYTGITSQLRVRVYQHKHKLLDGFTARYTFDMLVYFESFDNPTEAIRWEKQIKGWRREKKIKLISAMNPDWADLSAGWEEDPSWQSIPEAQWRIRRGS